MYIDNNAQKQRNLSIGSGVFAGLVCGGIEYFRQSQILKAANGLKKADRNVDNLIKTIHGDEYIKKITPKIKDQYAKILKDGKILKAPIIKTAAIAGVAVTAVGLLLDQLFGFKSNNKQA